jgi:uncharacterized protein YpmS
MKRCPTCNKTFIDEHLSFCVEDGTPLVDVDNSTDEATVVSPSPREPDNESNPASTGLSAPPVAAYQPPGSYVPPNQRPRRRAWPWVLSILVVILLLFVGLGIAALLLLPRMKTVLSNRENSNHNATVERPDNYNSDQDASNSNSAVEEDSSDSPSDRESEPAPTDEQTVLTDLTDLEHEWTVANINADKKKLNRILADDYVGTVEGKPQGKAEYLKTIERDTTIQKWEFENLKVKLKGDRATLTGNIRLVVQGQNVAYGFTDKFVWRDNRWQATSSEVTPLDEKEQ